MWYVWRLFHPGLLTYIDEVKCVQRDEFHRRMALFFRRRRLCRGGENCTCNLLSNVIAGMFNWKFYCVEIGDTTATSYSLKFSSDRNTYCHMRIGFGDWLRYPAQPHCFTYNDKVFLPCDESCGCTTSQVRSGYKIPEISSKFSVVDYGQ